MNPNPFATADPWDLVAEGYANELDWLMEPLAARAWLRSNLEVPTTLYTTAVFGVGYEVRR